MPEINLSDEICKTVHQALQDVRRRLERALQPGPPIDPVFLRKLEDIQEAEDLFRELQS